MQISQDEARRRLDACEENQVSEDLYSFGLRLLDEAVERVHRIELKAASIFGYALTMVALVASTFSLWSPAIGKHGRWGMLAAMIALLVGGFFAARATSVKTYDWFSFDDWLRKECLNDFDTLKKYRVLTIRTVVDSHDEHSVEKTKDIRRAQGALFFAGICFFVTLAYAILSARS